MMTQNWVKYCVIMSVPSVENFCFFPSLPPAQGGEALIRHRLPFLPLMVLPISILLLNYLDCTHLLAAGGAVLEEGGGGEELLKVPQRPPDGVRHDPQHALQVLL